MTNDLAEKILSCGYVDMHRHSDGSFYLTIDGGLKLSEDEARQIWTLWGEVWYTTWEDNKTVAHQESL